jgi:hypothetical protein
LIESIAIICIGQSFELRIGARLDTGLRAGILRRDRNGNWHGDEDRRS